jgi:hypothetical protein
MLGLDKGSVMIMLAMIDAVAKKGVNEIHPSREMDMTGKKQWFLTNLSRPRFHGLIAYVDGKKGYYCLTRKAGMFLRNESIAKYAIISKVSGHQEGYWMPEENQVRMRELLGEDIMWEGEIDRMIDSLYRQETKSMPTLF